MLPYSELNTTESPVAEGKVSAAEVWGYGFLFVTVINMSAFAGVWVIPLMNKKLYKHVLMYLVSLAVGTLAGNALLSLIPESQGILLDKDGHDFIWKNMVVLAGLYLFFNTERILKIIGSRRRERARRNKLKTTTKQPSVQVTAMHNLDSNPDRIGYKFTSPVEAMAMTDAIEHSLEHEAVRERAAEKKETEAGTNLLYSQPTGDTGKTPTLTAVYLQENEKGDAKPDSSLLKYPSNGHPGNLNKNSHSHSNNARHGHSHAELYDGDNMIATVAYMIIFGDGLHNFIDGLAIGASFTNSIYQGISTSVAVICEEFPHELGDFAILLNSGMTVKQAVLANFLSACTCYLGLIIGIILGENFHASEWIFALAGGMFLYISLVDMLPEINNVGGGDPLHEDQRSIKIFLIQNLGLLTGFGLMLILALFAGHIQI